VVNPVTGAHLQRGIPAVQGPFAAAVAAGLRTTSASRTRADSSSAARQDSRSARTLVAAQPAAKSTRRAISRRDNAVRRGSRAEHAAFPVCRAAREARRASRTTVVSEALVSLADMLVSNAAPVTVALLEPAARPGLACRVR